MLVMTNPARAGDGAAARLRPMISLRHPGVDWIDTSALAASLDDPDPEARPRLLDSRTEAEYAVSHLAGATRVDPDDAQLDPTDWPHDTLIVVYCSVGYRSAAVARRLGRAGFTRVYNLQGGIFEWANEDRPVERDGVRVEVVHPYGGVWGQMLDARFHPVD